MGVLGSQRADGRGSDVRDERVRSDVAGHVAETDLGPIVDGAAFQENLSALVEADAPTGTRFLSHRERACFEVYDPSAEIRAVTDDADKTRHTCSSELGVGSRSADRADEIPLRTKVPLLSL